MKRIGSSIRVIRCKEIENHCIYAASITKLWEDVICQNNSLGMNTKIPNFEHSKH